VYYLTREIVTPTPQVTVGDFTTKYFVISGGDSKNKFNELRDGGMSTETLQNFAQMEDQFLGYEYQTVVGAPSVPNRVIEATQLSEQIKDTFPGYEFGYHAMHIKQMSEPLKKINPYLK
jgi:hypothetical protein